MTQLKKPHNSKAPVILIAEDKELNMIISKQMVTKLYPGAKIIEAINGQEAVAMTKRKKPDIILLDIKMPVMDGTEAIKEIRSFEFGSTRKTPIIALTAETQEEGVMNYLELGFNEIVAKPTEIQILKNKLAKFIDN